MPRQPLPIEQVLSLLAAAPPRIAGLTAGLSPEQLRTAPAPGEWSATGILAHLRACADVWGDCIARIIDEDRPTLRAMDPRTWMERTDYPDLAFAPSFAAFAAQRAGLLTTLHGLPADDWSRAATVTGAGRPLERTVHFYAQWLATHERTHLRQLQRTVDVVRRQATTIDSPDDRERGASR